MTLPHQLPSEDTSHEIAYVEVGHDKDASAAAVLQRLADSLESTNVASGELGVREELLREFAEVILHNLASQGYPWAAEGNIPEAVRLEVRIGSEIHFRTVIYAAQQLAATLGHGVWLAYGNHGNPLHLCPQTITICV